TTAALKKYTRCRTLIAQAVEADAVVRSISKSQALKNKQADALGEMASSIDGQVEALLKRPAASLDSAIETLGLQLSLQGVGRQSQTTVAPFTYGTTRFSSVFARTAAAELTALLQQKRVKREAVQGPLTGVGTYTERGKVVRLSITLRHAKSGALVATARA
ncbi:unnamed protein product, partial [Laminaria digitata]